MNDKLITRIAFMALGACFGASAAYYVVDKKYSEEVEGFKQSCEEYKTEMKRYKKELETALSTFEEAGVTYDLAKEVSAKNRQRRKEAEENIALSGSGQPYVSYDKVNGGAKSEEKTDIPANESKDEGVGILISQDDFCSDNGNEKGCCTYYEDHYLVIDTDNTEMDVSRLSKVVKDALGEMGPYSVLYMSVDGVDYEVTYSDEYWKP